MLPTFTGIYWNLKGNKCLMGYLKFHGIGAVEIKNHSHEHKSPWQCSKTHLWTFFIVPVKLDLACKFKTETNFYSYYKVVRQMHSARCYAWAHMSPTSADPFFCQINLFVF